MLFYYFCMEVRFKFEAIVKLHILQTTTKHFSTSRALALSGNELY